MLAKLLSEVIRKRPAESPSSARGVPALEGRADRRPNLELQPGAIVFVTACDTPTRISPGMSMYSPLASLRLRNIPVALALAASRPVYFWPVSLFSRPEAVEALGATKTLVITKFAAGEVVAHAPHFEALMRWLSSGHGKVRVIADMTDNYAGLQGKVDATILGRYQQALASHCVLTVPCEGLRKQLLPASKHGIHVIEDPFESPRQGEPKSAIADPVRLCWFGTLGKNNLDTVANGLVQAARGLGGRAAALEIVTHESRGAMVTEIGRRLTVAYPTVSTRFVPWSPEATWKAIDDCDVVLIPQEHDDPWGSAKSHNRLVEAIRGGRFAVASPIPSYLELSEFAWIGDDLAEGVSWALTHTAAAHARVRAGQARVAERFSPQRIVGAWTSLLSGCSESSTPAPVHGVVRSAPAIRLNLGCGDKILPDYVNVDIAATRAGRAPDVLCDLRDLKPFATGSADEVLAVHVVEHFWRWEVVAILKEWMRVLKPGGRMILECPNLIAACEALLKDPVGAAGPGLEGQRTMWVFYGDPSWQDPLMCHRWNYTPQSLSVVMAEAGMVNIRQEPAQFKLREPRDMRVVGEKPLV